MVRHGSWRLTDEELFNALCKRSHAQFLESKALLRRVTRLHDEMNNNDGVKVALQRQQRVEFDGGLVGSYKRKPRNP
jgi:hypothetical protein